MLERLKTKASKVFCFVFHVVFKISNCEPLSIRPVVPGCAGCAMAHPDFGRSVNPISTRGDRLCPPNYYWHTRIFRPSDGPVSVCISIKFQSNIKFNEFPPL